MESSPVPDKIQAVGYVRVSGKSQIDGDGLERQRLEICQYADAHGIQVTEWFRELGVSGAKAGEDRPAWTELMLRVSRDGVRTILIERLDRLARDLMVQETVVADLVRRGVTLISALEPDLCKSDPTRTLLRCFVGAIAQYDRAMLVLKLRGARERVKARTGRCGGHYPYGHYPGEAEVLAQIRQRHRSGECPDAITRSLNASGFMARSGRPWKAMVVGRIVKREAA
jgi:DNA invertase Pin-like site-specific DNA recombinase